MALQIGQWRLDIIEAGRFRLDGGVMYGVVPKFVWERFTPPDAQNRLPYAIRCILARRPGRTVLIDTGQGEKLSKLERSSHALEPGNGLLPRLAELGVAPGDIDTVLFSHLHWDHAGGATQWNERGQPVPAFPQATYVVNQWDWEDALSGAPEFAGTYDTRNLLPLQHAKQLQMVNCDTEVAPGLRTRISGGHTRGHQLVQFESEGQTALFLADLVPAATHLRQMWCTAYDLFPLITRRRKAQLLGEAADGGWWVIWEHDPDIAYSRLQRHPKKEFVVVDERGIDQA